MNRSLTTHLRDGTECIAKAKYRKGKRRYDYVKYSEGNGDKFMKLRAMFVLRVDNQDHSFTYPNFTMYLRNKLP